MPILILFAVAVLIDRIAAANPRMTGLSFSSGQGSRGLEGSSAADEAPDGAANQVAYFCTEGQIVADFGPESVGLMLADGRTFSLPQVRSGSGIRYEKDGIEFVGKGDQAFVAEKGKTIYSNCIAGSVSEGASASKGSAPRYSFVDQSETFSFSYERQFNVVGSEIGLTDQWRQNASSQGSVLAMVVIPKSFQPKTNFSEAVFSIGTSADPAAVASCLKPANGETADGTAVIGGLRFSKIRLGDAGAGNFRDIVSYRLVRDGQCYAIEHMIHYLNIGAFDPSQGIAEFDRARVEGALEGMVASFAFLK